MTKKIKTDLLVIGAGAGGLSISAGAAQLGVKVVLLEGDKMGGDCRLFYDRPFGYKRFHEIGRAHV